MDPVGQILIAANRLPVTVRVEGGAVEVTPSPGGLASAMRPIHEGGGSRWIGWPGDLGRLDDTVRGQVDVALRERGLVPVELSAAEVTRYYDNFSNGVLWPLFHYLTERLRLDANLDWNAYRDVNERFAATVAETWRPGDVVWVHDYHLMLVPQLLRRRIPDARIGFFLHIPFPAAEVFRLLPWREPLLRGLLAADLVGFHTADYAHHFRYAATQLVGVEDLGDDLMFEDHRVHVGAYPIGIDVAQFVDLAGRPEVAELTAAWRHRVAGQRMVVGVDRLDYTKGIARRLLALERMFERWPAWRERMILVQLAVPTRERIEEYAAFRRDIHELVGRINGRFGTPGWAPIHFLHRSVPPTELVALYRAADVMLITPLRDGMNLVAKEFCASRTDDRGVLVLSELAGASAELREALLINPYDLDATAAAIRRGLAMPAIEQQVRMKALRTTVADNDVHVWAERLLGDLARVTRPAAEPTDATAAPLASALTQLRDAPRRVLMLDYDGTLVPFAPMPELAFPDDELRGLLAGLASTPGTTIHVVSGRSRASLDGWLGDLPIGLHAEHGFWSRWPGQSWTSVMTAAPVELATVELIMNEVVRRIPGSFVEKKGASLAWHYRMAEPLLAARRLDELRRRLRDEITPTLEILEGNKVLEVRVRGADKAAVGRRILAASEEEEEEPPALLAVGDDRTDEDLFAAMPPGAVTVRVGPGATRARHRVGAPDDVRATLRALL